MVAGIIRVLLLLLLCRPRPRVETTAIRLQTFGLRCEKKKKKKRKEKEKSKCILWNQTSHRRTYVLLHGSFCGLEIRRGHARRLPTYAEWANLVSVSFLLFMCIAASNLQCKLYDYYSVNDQLKKKIAALRFLDYVVQVELVMNK